MGIVAYFYTPTCKIIQSSHARSYRVGGGRRRPGTPAPGKFIIIIKISHNDTLIMNKTRRSLIRYEYLKNELTSCCFAIFLTATQVIFVCRLFVSDMQKCTLILCTLYFMFLSYVLKFGCTCIYCIFRKN